MMKTRLILKPGQRGTKKLVTQYGERLVAVRYRYDAQKRKRYKTVELIVEEADWEPKPEKVLVRIRLDEGKLQNAARKAGGVWNPDIKLWEMPYKNAIRFGLGERIVDI